MSCVIVRMNILPTKDVGCQYCRQVSVLTWQPEPSYTSFHPGQCVNLILGVCHIALPAASVQAAAGITSNDHHKQPIVVKTDPMTHTSAGAAICFASIMHHSEVAVVEGHPHTARTPPLSLHHILSV